MYLPEKTDGWEAAGLRGPGYFGQPSDSLQTLGQRIADDPRFPACVAKTVYAYLAQIPRDEVPYDIAAEYHDALVEHDYRPQALVRKFVLSDAYQAQASAALDPSIGLLALRPEQYSRTIAELTGFHWTISHEGVACSAGVSGCKAIVDLSLSDRAGFRAMAGGIDSAFVTEPVFTPMPVRTLIANALANEAAAYVVRRDLGGGLGQGDGPALLDLVGPDTRDEASVREQLTRLHLRLYAEQLEADAPAIDLSWGLFSAALADKGEAVDEAWIVTLSAMLQDPHLTFY